MSKVYFVPVAPGAGPEEFSAAASKALESLVTAENVALAGHIPLKLHFGEKGNRTYLPSRCYDGVIDFLLERSIRTEFTETSVLYGGERFTREKHRRLAAAHGFTRLEVVIADGEKGEDAVQVPVKLKHFNTCAIAAKLAEAEQVLVLSHFKGHTLAGFGGALKQLSMGFAAKGGKLAMHMSVQPVIRNWFCRRCHLCETRCQTGAISITAKRSSIDHSKCVGCGACFSICPHHAVSIWSLRGICNALFHRNVFRERLAEYAYASSCGKRHIYLNYAVNVTAGCDCEPRPMRTMIPDVGIFASLDPVAVDAACFDAAVRAGRRFKGEEILDYAEKIGAGSRSYDLVEVR